MSGFAAGLPVRDTSGTSDPYAVVKVIDQREAGQEAEEHRTRVVHRTTAPVFDQNFAFRLGKVRKPPSWPRSWAYFSLL